MSNHIFKPGAPPNLPTGKPDLANLSQKELSSNQEVVVVPYLMGHGKRALHWITPPYNLVRKQLQGPPSEFSQIAGWYVFGAGVKAIDSKAKHQQPTEAYYGDIAGVICVGPIDEFVALLLNGAVIWPTRKYWANSLVQIPVSSFKRKNNVSTLELQNTHGLKVGQKVIIASMSNATFNGTFTLTGCNDTKIRYTQVLGDVTITPETSGTATQSVHYVIGDIVLDGFGVWKCNTDHDSDLTNRPPDISFWDPQSTFRAIESNPFNFTVPGFGEAWLYWGTDTQTLDTVGEQIMSQTGHPPYRRQAFIVLRKFLFGAQPVAPTIEALVRIYVTDNGSVISVDADSDSDGQVNPAAGLAKFLTDPVFGPGLVQSDFETTSWQSVATDLSGRAADTYVSPILERAQSVREIVAQFLTYFDGLIRYDTTGKLQLLRRLHDEAPPAFTDANTIDFNDLTEEIKHSPDGWSKTTNETIIKFQDGARAFKDASIKDRSQFNREVVGVPKPATIERSWINRELQATRYAAEFGKINALPNRQGQLSVRAEKTLSVLQGDVFLLTHDSIQRSFVVRCMQKTIMKPPKGVVRLQFELERGSAPIPFRPTRTNPVGTALPTSGLIALYQLLQVPTGFVFGSQDFRLVVLAHRQSNLTLGLNLFLKLNDSSLFTQIGEQHIFGVMFKLTQGFSTPTDKSTERRERTSNVAKLKITAHPFLTGMHATITGVGGAGYNVSNVVVTKFDADHITYPCVAANEADTADAAGIVHLENDDDSEQLQAVIADDFFVQEDLDRLMVDQSVDDIDNDNLIVFLVKSGDPTVRSIETVRAVRLDTGTYKFKVRRARFGTARTTFATNDSLFMIFARDVVTYTQDKFEQSALTLQAATFKLQATTQYDVADLTDANVCPSVAFTFFDPNIVVPSFPVHLQQRANLDSDFVDVPASSVTVWDPSVQFQAVIRFDSPNSIVSGELDAIQGVQRIKLWSASAQVQGSWQSSVVFSLPSGNWVLELVGVDQNGRVTKVRAGSGIGPLNGWIFVLQGSSSRHVGTMVSPESGTYPSGVLAVNIIDPTLNGLNVRKYSLVALGANPGAYTNASSLNITIPPGSGKTLYTKQTLSGVDTLVRRDDYVAAPA